MLRPLALALALAALPMTALSAQTDGLSAAQVDSLVAAARVAGVAAANQRPVAGYWIAGLAAGTPAGFILPLTLVTGAGEGILLSAANVSAIALLGQGAYSKDASPPLAVRLELQRMPQAYQDAFGDAFADRLRRRRTRAVMGGTAVGAVAAGAFTVWMIVVLTGTGY